MYVCYFEEIEVFHLLEIIVSFKNYKHGMNFCTWGDGLYLQL